MIIDQHTSRDRPIKHVCLLSCARFLSASVIEEKTGNPPQKCKINTLGLKTNVKIEILECMTRLNMHKIKKKTQPATVQLPRNHGMCQSNCSTCRHGVLVQLPRKAFQSGVKLSAPQALSPLLVLVCYSSTFSCNSLL